MSSHDTSLKNLNTFAIDAQASQIITATRSEHLTEAWHLAQKNHQPLLLLGEGSNVLFLENFAGIVAVNRLKGIDITQTDSEWLLHVGAGENWHQLVCHTLENNIAGLENLALIPGCVGSAPIQNIGAYGIELQSLCNYVDVLNLESGEVMRLSAIDCLFGYRESIFKHSYRDGYAIIAVGLRLQKDWQPKLTYGDLTRMDPTTVTPQQIFESVCAMRRSKLPDPAKTGNAGSFYKNPIVDAKRVNALLAEYPNMPVYPQHDGNVKLAAGWLVENAGLKGFNIGGAAVHQQQALVLINQHNATSADVLALASYVRDTVAEKFSVWLEPEVRFISAQGEVNAVEALS
ncbi:UDP-N-acetylmuramate dehydrogenase [Rouxiella badensis]|jgi:UDP-N-acetylmuramate dehydrogenase|nr:UDP-N-acetylmuramate dehydrogenase [Rouxiella badensis]MCC3705621.1 UDP-N-acetylmuramate dehydrogenase [Rouxiella badensis]MCC3721660.1 UDP-N-acetylmuramate dehydrogenase [Rouxiella badensis]MCC3731308.1 UDP-N-acetylmuramate dehydrogenase [Rouxiella badensis]MCC3736031.1 UDP-N-acetylmuramate dehydrogenase [Rouxiella badensis]MCC3742938.1 UDP-N-acetylmuramate dehydrogenase [Rouxiella badensis]